MPSLTNKNPRATGSIASFENAVELSMTWEERWSHDRFEAMCKLWNLKDQDAQNMRQLQENLNDVIHWKNDPFEVMRFYKEYYLYATSPSSSQSHRGTALRKVETMFRQMIAWRHETNADTLLARIPTPDPHWHQLPCQMLETCDYDGDPVLVDRIGAADSWGLFQHFGVQDFVQQICWIRELHCHPAFWQSSQSQNTSTSTTSTNRRHVRHFSIVVDLQGLHAGHMRPGLLPLFHRVARISQECYAGWEKRIIVIRAPRIFKVVWSITKHFFDKHIQESIIFGTQQDYLQVLSQYMKLEGLPDCIAPGVGTAKGYPGYFQQVSLAGGPFRRIEDNDNHDDIMLNKEAGYETGSVSSSDSSSEQSCKSKKNRHSVKVVSSSMMKGTWKPTSTTNATPSIRITQSESNHRSILAAI
ncbi:SEC14-like protein 5 [Seminavis robusta]|uniref:SEC14-like protein 5 n=1 Tax=Seminavis robusta TaxID=568900 RepID=A0A9N8DJN8_9STRA|nr:SEC14-like protein 5 [Seminavis robusta]|eukprot:Sro96_g049520.1 SEC14-like protein 5 (415) ;mRNA; r:36190-37434